MCLCHLQHRERGRAARISRRHFLQAFSGAVAAPLVMGCDEIGGFPFQLVSDEKVRQLGLESWERIRAQTALSSNADYQQALQSVGQRLLGAADADPDEWELTVFAGSEVNAFALPGGKVGVFEGMFQAAGNLDQLAAVVGHEIGHHQAEHSKERLSVAALKNFGLRLISTALQLGDIQYANEIAALLGAGIEFGLIRPYSRHQELEADRLGLFTMVEAGFDPQQAVELWRRMDRLSDGRSLPFLSTHPAPLARAEEIEELLSETVGRDKPI